MVKHNPVFKHLYAKIVPLLMLFLPLKMMAQASLAKVLASDSIRVVQKNKTGPGSFIIPAALISYGAISLASPGLKTVDLNLRKAVYLDRPHAPLHIDDYSQYAPAAAVFGLQLAGIKGKHTLKDQAIIYAMAMTISTAIVVPTKRIAAVERPDGSNFASFPSGHTATAFVAAEFLRREYKDQSPWYGIAGYTVAAGTGFLRMYNNKHWFSDVVAGAGIGMASTTLAYWLHGKIFPTQKQKRAAFVYPYYSDRNFGIGFVKRI